MFEKLNDDAILPQAQTKHSAGFDVCASEDVTIFAGQTKKGDRVGQLILHKHYGIELLGDRYRKDTQRVGGFGSTNK